jgi:hypothetical protein
MVSLTGRCFCCFGLVSDGVSCRGKKRRNTCRVRGKVTTVLPLFQFTSSPVLVDRKFYQLNM